MRDVDDPHRQIERAVAECVVRSFPEVSIHEMSDAPDADLLHIGGFHVGLEIVRTINQAEIEARPRMRDATELIKSALEARNVRGGFDVLLELADMGADSATHRTWLRDLPGKLVPLLAAHTGSSIETPELLAHGITRIARIERRESVGTFVSLGWRSRTPQGQTLAEITLRKKHERLRHYRERNGDYYQQYWLAIDGIAPGVVEDGGFMMLLMNEFATDYDRVLLIWHSGNGRLAEARDVTPTRKPAAR